MDETSKAAAALSRKRWAKHRTKKARAAQTEAARAGNANLTTEERRAAAEKGALSPEAARERALKAWATKRKNAAKSGKKPKEST